MNNKLMRLAAIAGVFTVAIAANATIYTFNDPLSGSQSVPSNTSTATGNTFGTYDDVTKMLTITVAVTGLSSITTNGHIHQAPAGSNGGVIVPFSGFGLTTYNYSNTHTLTAGMEAAFLANGTYVNIHTQAFPGGEVRGQLRPTAVPEPATMMILIPGIAAMLKRRKK